MELDAETYEVRAVRAGGEELDFTHEGGTLAIMLGAPLAAGETLVLEIDYGGSDIDVDATQYGMAASYDLGLDFKAETDANPQLINTLSFPEGARHWYPSVDHPADRATFELLATVREDWKVLSNGRLVGISEGARPGTRTHHWRLDEPHPTYLSVLVAGPYEVIEDFHGSVPVNYWVYPKDVEDADRSFHKTTAIMAFFDEEFGVPYPWNKYDQITIPGIGGGAESTTATVLGQSTIHDERAEQDFPSHGLVAHEVAHHWWGDLTTYRDWGETWLTESFGTYSEYRWHAYELGPDEAGENMRRKRESYLRQAETVLRPVVTNQWRRPNDNFDSHTYPKGAALIRLLRHITGDAEFRAGIQALPGEALLPAGGHRGLHHRLRRGRGSGHPLVHRPVVAPPGPPGAGDRVRVGRRFRGDAHPAGPGAGGQHGGGSGRLPCSALGPGGHRVGFGGPSVHAGGPGAKPQLPGRRGTSLRPLRRG